MAAQVPTQDVTDPRPMSRMGKIAAVIALSIVGLTTLTVLGSLLLQQKHYIASGSMLPTLDIGELAMFTPLALAGKAEPGDIVTYDNMNAVWLGRYIAGPGDKVSIKKGILTINGREATRREVERPAGSSSIEGDGLRMFEETLPNGRSYLVLDYPEGGPADNMAELTVADGHAFLLGDNRDNSFDSRFPEIGFIPLERLRAKHSLIYFSAGPEGLRLDRMLRWAR